MPNWRGEWKDSAQLNDYFENCCGMRRSQKLTMYGRGPARSQGIQDSGRLLNVLQQSQLYHGSMRNHAMLCCYSLAHIKDCGGHVNFLEKLTPGTLHYGLGEVWNALRLGFGPINMLMKVLLKGNFTSGLCYPTYDLSKMGLAHLLFPSLFLIPLRSWDSSKGRTRHLTFPLFLKSEFVRHVRLHA